MDIQFFGLSSEDEAVIRIPLIGLLLQSDIRIFSTKRSLNQIQFQYENRDCGIAPAIKLEGCPLQILMAASHEWADIIFFDSLTSIGYLNETKVEVDLAH
jgi:hypothetical protein